MRFCSFSPLKPTDDLCCIIIFFFLPLWKKCMLIINNSVITKIYDAESEDSFEADVCGFLLPLLVTELWISLGEPFSPFSQFAGFLRCPWKFLWSALGSHDLDLGLAHQHSTSPGRKDPLVRGWASAWAWPLKLSPRTLLILLGKSYSLSTRVLR